MLISTYYILPANGRIDTALKNALTGGTVTTTSTTTKTSTTKTTTTTSTTTPPTTSTTTTTSATTTTTSSGGSTSCNGVAAWSSTTTVSRMLFSPCKQLLTSHSTWVETKSFIMASCGLRLGGPIMVGCVFSSCMSVLTGRKNHSDTPGGMYR